MRHRIDREEPTENTGIAAESPEPVGMAETARALASIPLILGPDYGAGEAPDPEETK